MDDLLKMQKQIFCYLKTLDIVLELPTIDDLLKM